MALLHRAKQAGVEGFSLYRMRHSFASRWLASGGTEGGLTATAGWSSREMVDRYSHATAGYRAQAEARRLALATFDGHADGITVAPQQLSAGIRRPGVIRSNGAAVQRAA